MRICIDARSLGEPEPSGIGVYAYHVVRHMVEQSPQDHFVLFTSGRQQPDTEYVRALVQYENVEHVHVGWPNKILHAAAWLGVAPSFEHWVGQYDVLFAPNIHIMPRSVAPMVVTVHDVSYELFPHCLSTRRKLWHRVVNPRRLLAKAKSCIAVSATTAHDVHAVYGIDASATTVIPSAVPEPAHEEADVDLPDQFLLVLSTVEPRKNITGTVAAFEQYQADHPESNLNLVVIGASGWKSADVINRMNANPDIQYLGYATPEQKQLALRLASALVYPSIYEGFGFPPLEALQAGTPVMASRVGALPEVLQDAAYYVDPYSIADMASGMHTIHTDTALRQQLLANSQTVLDHLSWTTTAEHTLQVLKKAL